MTRPIGLSTTNHQTDYYGFLLALEKERIEVCELSASLEVFQKLDPQEYVQFAREHHITIRSLHLPFGGNLTISNLKKEEREHTLQIHKQLISAYAPLGIHYFVVHPSGEPIIEETRQQELQNAQASLIELATYADAFQSTICIEDLPRTCIGNTISEMKQLVSVDPRLRITFDTNHLMSGELQDTFLKELGQFVVNLHVSDYDFINERHWLPGEGKIDWVKFMDALDACGYDGPLMYEISFPCTKTIYRPRDLTPKDFVENAQALFERKKPKVISTPKPNLGMWE